MTRISFDASNHQAMLSGNAAVEQNVPRRSASGPNRENSATRVDDFVDLQNGCLLEKCCRMNIDFEKSVPIQPITGQSLPNFAAPVPRPCSSTVQLNCPEKQLSSKVCLGGLLQEFPVANLMTVWCCFRRP